MGRTYLEYLGKRDIYIQMFDIGLIWRLILGLRDA
jgi:hypothetical protein